MSLDGFNMTAMAMCTGDLVRAINEPAPAAGFRLLNASLNQSDFGPVTGRLGEGRVAGGDRHVERFAATCVVCRDVVARTRRARQQIEMGVPVKIEVGEIRNVFGRAVR